jgi:hypothetical protein
VVIIVASSVASGPIHSRALTLATCLTSEVSYTVRLHILSHTPNTTQSIQSLSVCIHGSEHNFYVFAFKIGSVYAFRYGFFDRSGSPILCIYTWPRNTRLSDSSGYFSGQHHIQNRWPTVERRRLPLGSHCDIVRIICHDNQRQ